MSQVIDKHGQILELNKLYEFCITKGHWEVSELKGLNTNMAKPGHYYIGSDCTYIYIRECSVSVGTIRTPAKTLKEPT